MAGELRAATLTPVGCDAQSANVTLLPLVYFRPGYAAYQAILCALFNPVVAYDNTITALNKCPLIFSIK
jgi:hypothetical protein